MSLQSSGGPAVGAQLMQSDRPLFVVPFVLAPTAAMDLVSLLASAVPGRGVLRVRRVAITNPGMVTAAALVTLQLGSIATIGSAGAVATPRVVDGVNDTAATCTAHTGDTTVGGTFAAIYDLHVWIPGAIAVAAPAFFDFGLDAFRKAPCVSNATLKGFSLRHPGVAGASGLAGYVEFTEEAN